MDKNTKQVLEEYTDRTFNPSLLTKCRVKWVLNEDTGEYEWERDDSPIPINYYIQYKKKLRLDSQYKLSPILKIGKDKNYKFFTSMEVGDKKYVFKCYPDVTSFLNIYNTSYKNSCYEVITGESMFYEFFDIETTDKIDKLKFFNECMDVFKKVYTHLGIRIENIRVSDSSRLDEDRYKLSFHIINRDRIYKSMTDMKNFYKKFIAACKLLNLPVLIDLNVASKNRSMRMIHSSKFTEERPFVPAEFHEASRNANIEEFFITSVPDNSVIIPDNFKKPVKPKSKDSTSNIVEETSEPSTIPTNYLITSNTTSFTKFVDTFVEKNYKDVYVPQPVNSNGFIELKRITPGQCPVLRAKRIHDRLDAYIFQNRLHNVKIGCFCESNTTKIIGKLDISPTEKKQVKRRGSKLKSDIPVGLQITN